VFAKAVKAAGLENEPRLRFHDFRNTLASILISQGLDVVWISRQIGHSNPTVTLNTYADLFARERHADAQRLRLAEEFGSTLDGWGTDGEQTALVPRVPVSLATVVDSAQLREIKHHR
jgi:hypothetical protein